MLSNKNEFIRNDNNLSKTTYYLPGSYTPYIASLKRLCSFTLSKGISCVNNTAVRSFTGSTQNNVLAAPSQKNSPTMPLFSSFVWGGEVRTAKSIPKPTRPLEGNHIRLVIVSDN